MRSPNDRPFRNVEKVAVAAEFVVAAERLILHDVQPELLPERERATLKYYLDFLSKKFSEGQGDPS